MAKGVWRAEALAQRELVAKLQHELDEALAASGGRVRNQARSLEAQLADRLRVQGAVAFATEAQALDAALRAVGVGVGSDLLLPALAPPDLALVASRLGARVRIGDVGPSLTLEAEFASPTAAVVVDLDGFPVDAEAIGAACGGPVVEDARLAFGASLHGRPAGSRADVAVFGLGPWSVLRAGAGAVCVAQRDEVLDALRREARLAEPAGAVCALARASLAVAHERLERAAEVAAMLSDAARENGKLLTPRLPSGGTHAYGAFRLISTPSRELAAELRDYGVPFRQPTPPISRHRALRRAARPARLTAERVGGAVLARPPWSVDPDRAEEWATAIEQV